MSAYPPSRFGGWAKARFGGPSSFLPDLRLPDRPFGIMDDGRQLRLCQHLTGNLLVEHALPETRRRFDPKFRAGAAAASSRGVGDGARHARTIRGLTGERGDKVTTVASVASQRTDRGIPHAVACRTLGLSESWFYLEEAQYPYSGS